MKKFPALGGALMLAVTGAFIAAPAAAFTHHPATAKERAETRKLNEQSLAQAQSAPANQQAMNANRAGQQPAAQGQAAAPMTNQNGAAGTDQTGTNAQTAPSATAPANSEQTPPPASSDASTPQSQKPPQTSGSPQK